MHSSKNRRVLIIDDNPSIHEDFRKILGEASDRDEALAEKEALLFGETQSETVDMRFEVDSAHGGEEGIEMVKQALDIGDPYAVAFVDIRMPPGLDGVETIERIWPTDQQIQFVVCSAYSDYSAHDVIKRLGISDRLLLLRKPCDTAEILLIASALCEKWNLTQPVGL